MAGSRIPGPLGTCGAHPEVDTGTLTLGATPAVTLVGQRGSCGLPPTGLLHARRSWRTLTPSMVRDLRQRLGRFGDGQMMEVPALRGGYQVYLQRWRDSVAASGPDSDNAVYWAMHCERMNELLSLYDSERGRFVLEMDKLTLRSDLGDREKFQRLREAQARYGSLRHDDAVRHDKLDPNSALQVSEEEDGIVRRALSEQLRLRNVVTRQVVAGLAQQAQALASQPPASDVMARREQRKRLTELIEGAAQKKGTPDDGLPHCLLDVVRQRLGLERQEQLMGGNLAGEDIDQLKQDFDDNVKAAMAAVKKLRVDAARQDLQDARRRIAEHGKLTDKVQLLKSETLIREQLSAGVVQVLGDERNRQLMGLTSDEPGAGANPGQGLPDMNITADDVELNRLTQEGVKLWADFKHGSADVALAVLQNTASGQSSAP